jgi:hypothetical protein
LHVDLTGTLQTKMTGPTYFIRQCRFRASRQIDAALQANIDGCLRLRN